MKRQFIKLEDVDIYDEFHQQAGDSFIVNEKLDGNTTEYHKEGIEMIKVVLERGDKVRPILVLQTGDRYKLLDGFKRAMAYKELGYPHIEAFVCTELDPQGIDPLFREVRACKGGQSEMSWFEAAAPKTEILSWNGKLDGLRIEISECYHVHWGEYGRFRLALGEEDFNALTEAVMKI